MKKTCLINTKSNVPYFRNKEHLFSKPCSVEFLTLVYEIATLF